MSSAVELEIRIAAAKRRLGDLKKLHSEWYRKPPCLMDDGEEGNIISEMEQIAYSVWCYLDGLDGPYRETKNEARGQDAVAVNLGDE